MHCGSKVKSEYMKRYKDPKWDTCGPCYRELLHYRLSRRLLEQTHNPWLWDGWGPSSNSDDSSSSGGGGASTPLGPQGASAPSPPQTPLKPEREGEELGVEEKGAEASEDEDAASPPGKWLVVPRRMIGATLVLEDDSLVGRVLVYLLLSEIGAGGGEEDFSPHSLLPSPSHHTQSPRTPKLTAPTSSPVNACLEFKALHDWGVYDSTLLALFQIPLDMHALAKLDLCYPTFAFTKTPGKVTQEKDKQQMEVKKEQIEVKDKLMDNTDHPRQRALLSGADKKTAKSPQRPSKTKEVKHPFALYGWGEKQTDTGSQKTHNVCASAPEQQIHESALRAKNRRQVEKRKLVNQRQRAYSVDVQKPRRSKPSSSDSPWMTEYMRCYSARA
ncbi:centriole, cilia and spindle-associated protein [Monodelphis domestica]|uniref:centriole, cilia and spindle-associated protein n=1 Tax=Monodelphis domestica TaxID=13616 RepID=UPI0024E1EBF0|nr:centriole, cilia and spindle-associated protein [Monodelphis domestica]